MMLDVAVAEVLDNWVTATLKRDAGAFADLFLRGEPHPIAVWSTGETSVGWTAIRDHAARDFSRGDLGITKVEIFDETQVTLADDAVNVVFRYEMVVRDVWGTETLLQRHATFGLKRMPYGVYRIATAHFSPA